MTRPTRVAVNGYGVIGKRVADAVRAQKDMTLVGVADVTTDWRTRVLQDSGVPLFAATAQAPATPQRRCGRWVPSSARDCSSGPAASCFDARLIRGKATWAAS